MNATRHPYFIIFILVFTALLWRPFLIGFYGDDFGLTRAESLLEGFFYDIERRERILYFIPIGLPRYYFGHNPVAWGFYALLFCALTPLALYSFFKALTLKLGHENQTATWSAAIGAVLYIFMPWSLTAVLWNTSNPHLVMVSMIALAGTTMLSGLSLALRSLLFVSLFSSASLMYESVWCAWVPLLLIKLSLDTQTERKDTFVMAVASIIAQTALVLNYLPSQGMQGTVKLTSGSVLTEKLNLFVENILLRLPFEMLSSMGIIGLVAIPIALYITYALFQNRAHTNNFKFWFIIVACISGIAGSIFIISLGNYRVAGTTEDGRTLSVSSFWLALMVTLVSSAILTKGTRRARMAGIGILVMIVISFFLRAGDWVKGYTFQQKVIASVPAEEIIRLTEIDESAVLLIEFDTPMHVFHGMHNNRGTQFVSKEIQRQTGKYIFAFPANGRLAQTLMEGTHIYQMNCVNPDELITTYRKNFNPTSLIFWHVGTGQVRRITPPFEYGCTRTIEKNESLGELLYPFMGNPRRF